jgi:hypothetical protein
MSGKKRKSAALLDYNTIKANAVANKSYLSEVREKIVAVNCVDIQRLLSGKLDLSEDEALQLLASKLSLTGLYNLQTALRHVPGNITRTINGIPLRTTLVHKLFTNMASANEFCSNLSIEEIAMYMKFVQTYCPLFVERVDSHEHLWRLTKTEDLSFVKFLTPPVSLCLLCEKGLTIRNNPSKAKLFTLDGPVPCTKVTLECRACSQVYGICHYDDKSGSHFYPQEFNVDLVEISDVTYMDLKLYKWFPALRFVTF